MTIKQQLVLAALALGFCAPAQNAVKIDQNPANYSAGKMTAAEIDKWFADNIKPEQFDLWSGKKDRLYLNGAWKFVRLTGMPPLAGKPENIHDRRIADSDFGEREGFFKPAFDDSKWFNQPVPLAWLDKFPPNKPGVVASSPILGWYRKSFEVPDAWKGRRVILTFNASTWRSSVYLNGKPLGVNENSRVISSVWVAGSVTEEAFSFDITDTVEFDAPNLLAVKVYNPSANGGVWQEVFLESRPAIYLEQALVTPEPEKNAIAVKAFVVNTTGKDAALEPTLELGPWKSARYARADGPVQTTKLAPMSLKPGMNEIAFEAPVEAPRFWSPARPYLYHLVFKDQAGTVLGQERFGYRTFTVGKDSFLLNGKPTYLRAMNTMISSWDLPGNYLLIPGFGLLNRDHMIERCVDNYMAAGFNLQRCHLGILPLHIFREVADEKGLMLYPEEGNLAWHKGVERLDQGEAVLKQVFKDSIRRRCAAQFNNPSVVMQSLHNECYDSCALTNPFWKATGYGPMLRAIYNEYRAQDSSRPYTASSGRGPTGGGFFSPVTLQKNKGDFDDGHLYNSNRSFMLAEDDNWSLSYKNCKAAYTQDNGYERAMLDGESYWFHSALGTAGASPERAKLILPHLDKDGQFDRAWLAENLKENLGRLGLFEWSFIPYNVSADDRQCLRFSAWPLQKVMELERRKRGDLAGYALHQPSIFKGFTAGEPLPFTFEAAKRAQQPVLACLDGLFNRNMLTGQATAAKLYLLNDSEDILDKTTVELSLSGEGVKAHLTSVPFAALAVGGMTVAEIQLTPPDTLKSGHYQLNLDVKGVSHNEYALYLLNRGDVKLSAPSAGVVVYGAGGELAKILKQLGVTFRTIASFDQLAPADKVLLLPPGTAKDTKPLLQWLDGGGKLLALEPKELPPGLMPGRVGIVGGGVLGWWSEIVLHTHPAFNGLLQEDFRVWSGDGRDPMTMRVADDCVLPLQKSALSMIISTNSRMGMTLCEAKRGKGRVMISEFLAVGRFGKDAVATRYLLNLLDYALNSFDDPRAPVLAFKAEAAEAYKVDAKKAFAVDLRPAANMGLVDEVAGDKKGGWSDQGPLNDAHSLPVGEQTFAGVPFKIIAHGKACVALQGEAGTNSEFLPLQVEKIMVGKKARKLFFLLAGTWVPAYYMLKKNESLGKFDINMNINAKDGGTSGHYVVDLISSRNFGNWWSPRPVPEAIIGWRGLAGKSDDLKEVGAYVIEWVNPEPNVEIGWIDFSSSGRCVPILIAVTGEE